MSWSHAGLQSALWGHWDFSLATDSPIDIYSYQLKGPERASSSVLTLVLASITRCWFPVCKSQSFQNNLFQWIACCMKILPFSLSYILLSRNQVLSEFSALSFLTLSEISLEAGWGLKLDPNAPSATPFWNAACDPVVRLLRPHLSCIYWIRHGPTFFHSSSDHDPHIQNHATFVYFSIFLTSCKMDPRSQSTSLPEDWSVSKRYDEYRVSCCVMSKIERGILKAGTRTSNGVE